MVHSGCIYNDIRNNDFRNSLEQKVKIAFKGINKVKTAFRKESTMYNGLLLVQWLPSLKSFDYVISYIKMRDQL